MRKSLTLFDDYLAKPDIFLRESERLDYSPSGSSGSTLISARSRHALAFVRGLEKHTGIVLDWNWKHGSGTYRTTTQKAVAKGGTQFLAHSDFLYDYISILYLSPPTECHGGTGFYRHKETGLEGFHDLRALESVITERNWTLMQLAEKLQADGRTPSKWTALDRVQMKFNRLVFFDARLFHSHILDFGQVRKSSKRLTFVCFGNPAVDTVHK